MKDGCALSWARFVDEDRSKCIDHLLTMTVCMWEFYEFQATGKEHLLLSATAGIVDALQRLSDRKGIAHSMSPTSPPKISEKRLVAHINDYIQTREQDLNWRALLDTRINLISEHYEAKGYSHWPLMGISWWDMGQSQLIDTHTKLIRQRL